MLVVGVKILRSSASAKAMELQEHEMVAVPVWAVLT